MKRKPGFYWVKHLVGKARNPDYLFYANEWVPAYWNGCKWYMIAESNPASRSECGQAIAKIGRRIYRPR